MSPTPEFPSGALYRMLGESSRRGSTLHRQFLRQRQGSLQDVKTLISLQMNAAFSTGLAVEAPVQLVTQYTPSPALFSSDQLDEFGRGSIARCLGSAFSQYENRRIPRIPNGELKMMTRIVEIEGQPRNFNVPASVVAEYDVPLDAWYLRDNASPHVPCSVWMEIALQPCGFLSAYLDSYAFVPHHHFYFRNLDGTAAVGSPVDVRGKTITTSARLLTSAVSGGTVIQKYAFQLTCAGQVVYSGESTFGYFSAESMANQVGLDGGKPTLPWVKMAAQGFGAGQSVPVTRWQGGSQPLRLSQGQLNFLDQVFVSRSGGRYGQGYVYASRPVNPADWFYPFHFYQDPVMPGSLGVEAILQTMQLYALESGLGAGFRQPRFGLAEQSAMNWRYRGQITPQHRQTELEVHLKNPERTGSGLSLTGDASMWVDGLRIYEVKNAAVAILEG